MSNGVKSLIDHPIILWGGILAAVISFLAGTVHLYLYLEDQKELVSNLSESYVEHSKRIEALLLQVRDDQSNIRSELSSQTAQLDRVIVASEEEIDHLDRLHQDLLNATTRASLDIQYKLGEHVGRHHLDYKSGDIPK